MHENKDIATNKTHWITSQSLIRCNDAHQFMIEKDLEGGKRMKQRKEKKKKIIDLRTHRVAAD